jgi:hypothetical protein
VLNRLQHPQRAGVSIWCDDSNRTIFARAITGSSRHDRQLPQRPRLLIQTICGTASSIPIPSPMSSNAEGSSPSQEFLSLMRGS